MTTEKSENVEIPLCLDDIIFVCKEYTKLGFSMQTQLISVLDNGIEQSLTSGLLRKEALPHLKSFLQEIVANEYFGEASDQARECVFLIEKYEEEHKYDQNILQAN